MADYKILTIPFARDAVPDMVNDIPDDPSISEPQLASFKQGFPYITTIPLVAGGIPPEGQDFNGILRDITEHVVHQNKGGMYKFEADIVAAGGYPKGAVLSANDGLSLWVSLVDANVQDFNSGTPTQWARIAFNGLDALLNSKLDKSAVVQATGVSTTNVMSQKAVTDAFAKNGIRGTYSNLSASAVGTNATVTFTADAICVKNASNEQIVLNNVSESCNLLSSGIGGLDTGAIAGNTWYAVYAIYNPTTLDVAAIAGVNFTAPTLPSGYTHYAFIEAVRTNSGATQLFPFTMDNGIVFYNPTAGTPLPNDFFIVLNAGTATTPTAVSLQGIVPPSAKEAVVGFTVTGTVNTMGYLVRGAAGLASGILSQSINNGSATQRFQVSVPRPYSSGVHYFLTNPGTASIQGMGWRS
jgi:hypothetical protein